MQLNSNISKFNEFGVVVMPLITIGMSAFNAEETIERSLESALAQDWRPIEIIVIDDCSTDNTAELIRRFANSNYEVRYLRHKKNMGVAAARNTIINNSLGEFIAFFDDDDVSIPSRLSKQIKRILEYESCILGPEIVICHSARQQIYPNGIIRIEQTIGGASNILAPSGIGVAKSILEGFRHTNYIGSCASCSQMARASTYRILAGFDINFRRSEDTDFNIRLAVKGGHFVGIDEPLVLQNMTKGSDKSIEQELYYWNILLKKHRSIFSSDSNYSFACRWIKIKYLILGGNKLRATGWLLIVSFLYPIKTITRLVGAKAGKDSRTAIQNFNKY